MDWFKLLALLVAVASVQTKADGPKKKIRIHLPQAVKHIHHHKKIYITNHPAPSQYAPAYMPSAEGAVAVPTNIPLPAVAKLMPINPVDMIEEPVRVPGLGASASKLVPLYRARGYYGPNHSEWDEQEYDFIPPSGPVDSYVVPTSVLAPTPEVHNHKRAKVVKVHEPSRKKIIHKPKQKRVSSRKPALVHHLDEHPVSTFHEQFYSDVQGSGTIRKIKKPPRFEKIVDGNTEHIHTYSEEHVHKMVYDDVPKFPGVMGVEPIAAMSAYTPFIPLKNGQLLAMAPNPYQTLGVAGSMGTPSQYEYAAFNPREVTHDHVFHDHGELPEGGDLSRDIFSEPPKVSYNSQGLPIGVSQTKRIKSKYSQRPTKTPSPDYTYYESIYTPNQVKPTKAGAQASLYVQQHEESLNEFKPVSTYRFKEGYSSKTRNKVPTYYGKSAINYHPKQQPNIAEPFSVSSKVVHDYSPNSQAYPTAASSGNGLSLFEDNNQFANFKDGYLNDFDYGTYASPSYVHRYEEKGRKSAYDVNRKGTKSISMQNVRFGKRGRSIQENFATAGDVLGDNDGVPSALENVEDFDQPQYVAGVTPTAYDTNHQYFTAIAANALNEDQLSEPDASNNNFQYAEAPTVSTTPVPTVVATTSSLQDYQVDQVVANFTSPPPQTEETQRYIVRDRSSNKTNSPTLESHKVLREMQPSKVFYKHRFHVNQKQEEPNAVSLSTERSKLLRYGDKI